MEKKQHSPSILMLPWLAHGHISPFLELAKMLSERNFHIYLCSTPINLEPIRETLPKKFLSSIQLIEIHLPSSPQLPPHYHTTKGLPPHLMSTLKTAFDTSKPAFSNILKSLKPQLVIYDFLQPWVPIAAREENINAVVFVTCGAATVSFLIHCANSPGKEYPFHAFHFPESECDKITLFMHDISNGLKNKDRFTECIERSSNIVLIKTSKEMEAKYVEYLAVLLGKEIVTVGPLVQEPVNKDDVAIMEWLSKKDPSSVVFVSFGSEYFLSKQEIEEIAHGLELSQVSFIWVVRFHGGDKISVDEALPEGFLKRIGEKGIVVEGWAPQAKILAHSSIGGFVSHCGWSSTLEGVMYGVPIIAMPMHLDQPLNARLVGEIGGALEVKRQNERLKREEIASVIKEVVVQEQGVDLRRKAKEVSERMRRKGDEEMDVVVEELMQLTGESR
ncbi:hypothetical protein L1049_025253 [Liquidambar formosana]|uniref:Glycosyltransferase n=1 Tax=Liquidambar formosana TaxID=63359 RepID=A0AAP0N622_LIQFO